MSIISTHIDNSIESNPVTNTIESNEVVNLTINSEGGSDAKYTHSQDAASATWTVNHNLGKYPSVTVVDSANSVVIGDVSFTSLNSLTVSFSAIFTGKVYCN